jgi:hypothetical protein
MLIETKIDPVRVLRALFHDPDSAALVWVFVTMQFLQHELDSEELCYDCYTGNDNTSIYMNASTVHSPLIYKYALCSLHATAMAATAKKQSAVLHDGSHEDDNIT